MVAALMLTYTVTSCIDMPCDRNYMAEFSLPLKIDFMTDGKIIKALMHKKLI